MRQDDASLRNVLSRRPHIGAAAESLGETNAPVVVDPDVLLHEDRVRPFRNRRSGKDAHGLPRRGRARRRAARHHATGNPDGRASCRGNIGKAHGISVHRRVCNRRERDRRNDVLREHTAVGAIEWNPRNIRDGR
jgi:hypothetical protein